MALDGFAAAVARFDLALTPQQQAQFARYLALLTEWNARLNLTAVRTPEEMVTRHFVDALTCTVATGSLNGADVVDVGSGAGFPGLPLKIAFPEMRLTLVESVVKKARFLETAVAEVGLSDVNVLSLRAEEIGQDGAYRERFDWAMARAVAELRVLAEYLLPLCRVGGHMLAQKGVRAAEETAAARTAIATLGGGDPALFPVQLPDQPEASYLVVVAKITATPARFPRRPGMPLKRPL